MVLTLPIGEEGGKLVPRLDHLYIKSHDKKIKLKWLRNDMAEI